MDARTFAFIILHLRTNHSSLTGYQVNMPNIDLTFIDLGALFGM